MGRTSGMGAATQECVMVLPVNQKHGLAVETLKRSAATLWQKACFPKSSHPDTSRGLASAALREFHAKQACETTPCT